MDISQRILSDLTVFMKYAKYIPEKQRRETWEELIDRNKGMHLKKFPQLKDEIESAYRLVYEKKVLPSMRSLQFAGKPIEINPCRMFNCSYQPIDDYRAFGEGMFLLLSGVGYGFSVQKHHVRQLPAIKKPAKERRFLIGDSIEGWSDAIKALIKAYLVGGSKPRFDFGDIRQKGALLITSGGKAPGPAPLKICLTQIEVILDRGEEGEKLTPLDCHDIMCHIADAVLSGGIRRSAMISMFSFDDDEMITCKYGNWWELNPQRALANNSAVVDYKLITQESFWDIWKKIEASNAGEPGLYFTNDIEYGTNPCVETSLRCHTFCNLVEINGSNVISLEDFLERCRVATVINTLQASYTDFHYLREIWKRNTEKDSLIGVGITGIGSNKIDPEWLKLGAEVVKRINEEIANLIDISPAARCTVVKPSGTSSLVLGTSSGIHAWHAPHYIRRMRCLKNESIYTYLSIYNPEMLEDEFFKPKEAAVITIPQKSPENAFYRSEDAITLLERVKTYNLDWVRTGHRKGPNYHNVSATVTIDKNRKYMHENVTLDYLNDYLPEDVDVIDEWQAVGNWIWSNKETFHGLSVLPLDLGSYVQTPFEDCSEDQYNEMMLTLKDIDLTKVVEIADNTDLRESIACGPSGCEIN